MTAESIPTLQSNQILDEVSPLLIRRSEDRRLPPHRAGAGVDLEHRVAVDGALAGGEQAPLVERERGDDVGGRDARGRTRRRPQRGERRRPHGTRRG